MIFMEPRIKTLPEKNFIGKRLTMSFTNNKTYEPWSSFMPKRKEIRNSIGTELYSIEVYAPNYFNPFNPDAEFEKWAAVEVPDFQSIPDGMESITSSQGLYAVSIHKGSAGEGPKTYQYIFAAWLPNSDFTLDNRPHFVIMGKKYKSEDPDSEEELLIPIKQKE